MAHDSNFPQRPSGVIYPKNYVVGVINDPQEAERAVQALQSETSYKLNRNIPVHVLIGGQMHHGHASSTQVTLEAIATPMVSSRSCIAVSSLC